MINVILLKRSRKVYTMAARAEKEETARNEVNGLNILKHKQKGKSFKTRHREKMF